MKTIEALLAKENHTQEELGILITRVKEDCVSRFKGNDIPQHCGLCELFRFCKIINHTLICPWF